MRTRRGVLNYALDKACSFHKRHSDALFLEFGVFEGVDLSFIADSLQKRKCAARVHGFDSFVGLPEVWSGYEEGHFTCGGALPQMLAGDDRVVFHKGWFEDTVPTFVSEFGGKPSAFIHADADLYSSTACFLTALMSNRMIVVGTVIVFDEFWNYTDWENGEYKALLELSAFGVFWEVLAYHAPQSDAVEVDLRGTGGAANRHGYKSVCVVITKIA